MDNTNTRPSCRDCSHLGSDPDGPYCGHAEAFKRSPVGMNLDWARGSNARYPEPGICGDEGRLFTLRTPSAGFFEPRTPTASQATPVRASGLKVPVAPGAPRPPLSWRELLHTGPMSPQRRRMIGLPEIVCLCGSTRFHDEFVRANYHLTMAGKIVLSVGFFVHHATDEELIQAMRTVYVQRPAGESYAETWQRVLAATRTPHHEGHGCTVDQKEALDQLHLRKIDLADAVYILNKGGYIGASTQRELAYALFLDKRLAFLEIAEGEAYLNDPVKQHELAAHMAAFLARA